MQAKSDTAEAEEPSLLHLLNPDIMKKLPWALCMRDIGAAHVNKWNQKSKEILFQIEPGFEGEFTSIASLTLSPESWGQRSEGFEKLMD